jgi:hypothetical protein
MDVTRIENVRRFFEEDRCGDRFVAEWFARFGATHFGVELAPQPVLLSDVFLRIGLHPLVPEVERVNARFL